MSAIVLLDTSVYLNVLDVPGYNQDQSSIVLDFERFIRGGNHFLLPLASVWETGNHIAHLPDGQSRRRYAQRLVDDVSKACRGEAPYHPTHFPDREEFLGWLAEFPDMAMRNKTPEKVNEGISLADLSIIKEWERTCSRHPFSRVRIWALDKDLSSYDSKSWGR